MLCLDFVLPIVRSMKEIPTAVRPLARPNVQIEDVGPVWPPGLWSVGISQVNVLRGLYQNSIYLNFACLYACLRPKNVKTLLVCMLVCVQKTSKRLNQSGPNLVLGLT